MKYAYLFPGQGAQYPSMSKDFFEQFSAARHVFEEADDVLSQNFSRIIFEGPKERLTETKNSQAAIFIASMAILQVVETLRPDITPAVAAGLSLGEYTALAAAHVLTFRQALALVALRGELMNRACERRRGKMAVILGLSAEAVEEMVEGHDELWAANFNCPGQVVISGTEKGIDKGVEAAKKIGAKRAVSLDVHGAFHSPLMKEAEKELGIAILQTKFLQGRCPVVMNASGEKVEDIEKIKELLLAQLTSPVRWEQGICAMKNIDLFIEMGPGKTLAGFNKRIDAELATVSITQVADLEKIQ